MSLASYITRRNGSGRYYVRLTIPADLQDSYGRKEIWKSLGTASASEAKALAPGVLQGLQNDFAGLRQSRDLLEEDIGALAWAHYVKLIETDEKFREEAPTEDDLDAYWKLIVAENGGDQEDYASWKVYASIRDMVALNQRKRQRTFDLLRSSDPNKRLTAVTTSLAEILEQRRIQIDRKSATYRKLALGIQRAELEAFKRERERDAGDWGGAVTDPMIRRAEQPKHAAAGEHIVDLYELFLKQKAAKLQSDTVNENRKVIALFAEHVGETTAVKNLSRKHVAEFRDQLAYFPAKARQISEFKNLKFPQIIERNRKLGRPTLAAKTVNKYLSALSPFAQWLLSSGKIEHAIMSDEMFITLDRSQKKRLPWTDGQLQAIFASPLFRRCESDSVEHKVGNIAVRDWRYWVPLIALYSGMRLGEIAQLLIDDVRQVHGVWIMHVTAEGDVEKRLKTTGSERVVPVHTALIKLGLLDYHAKCAALGQKRLFSEIKADARDFVSGVPSKFFGTYLKRIGVKTAFTTMHSFRHNFADRLRKAGHLDQDFGFILGHGDRLQSTTGRYGTLPQGTLQMRARLVESVDYSDLKLL